MPYLTVCQSPIHYQISLEDILMGEVDVSKLIVPNVTNTRTTFVRHFREEFLSQYNIPAMVSQLKQFNARHSHLFDVERDSLYRKFYIPKKSGGLREINAPKDDLMFALRELKNLFEKEMFALYHTSAFAYVKGRCTVDAIKRHQQNRSRWFAKLDFSDFFGSTTLKFVVDKFSVIFPFSEIVKYTDGRDALTKALSLCFLNGGLPQGTPISPTITNIMMIPIDYCICNTLRKKNFVYTRYADDMIISSKYSFSCDEVQNIVLETLKNFHAPFVLNTKKTRYGSSAGQNWNLGLMLNKDNDITVGHKAKKNFRAMCCNYIQDHKKEVRWDPHDLQVLLGHLSYYRMIEADYFNGLIKSINQKFGVDLESMIKSDLLV